MHCSPKKLPGYPFFRRYGVKLPSSLTEVRSSTWGEVPRPTSVGMRYGQQCVWRAAFLGDLGAGNFRPLPQARASRHGSRTGICHGSPLLCWQPVLSIRPAPSPYRVPALLLVTPAGAGISHLLAIAYEYNLLGLGPD